MNPKGEIMFSEEQEINELRQEIDRIDERLVEELNKRAKIVLEIGKLKNKAGLPVLDSQRENEIFTKLSLRNTGPLDSKNLKNIYEKILVCMKSFE